MSYPLSQTSLSRSRHGAVRFPPMLGLIGVMFLIIVLARPNTVLPTLPPLAPPPAAPPVAAAPVAPAPAAASGTVQRTLQVRKSQLSSPQSLVKTSPGGLKPLGPDPQPFDYKMMAETALIDPHNTQDIVPSYPPDITRLAGHTVTIKGFMTPYDDIENLKSFVLGARLIGCFFCAMPKPTEVALVRQTGTDKRPYINGPIQVTGTLKFWKEHSPDDQDLESFVYVIDNATVTPVK